MQTETKPIPTEEELDQKIEVATQTLERNIGFVANCDTKTSIVLTSLGVLLTLFLTNGGLSAILRLGRCGLTGGTLWDIFYLLCLAGAGGVLLFGIWLLVTVLVGRAQTAVKDEETKDDSSLLFFGGILKVGDLPAYRGRFLAMTKEELLDELIAEIYVNAQIATQKYRRYNRGIRLAGAGFALLMGVLLVGKGIYG